MFDNAQTPMDPMMEIFMVETNDFLNKIEDILMSNEQNGEGIKAATPEIFRIMHTIKSSSAMMSLENISRLTHKVEDLFYYLRGNPDAQVDEAKLIDIVFEAVDFIKRNLDGDLKEDPAEKIKFIGEYLESIKKGAAAPAEHVGASEQASAQPAAEAPARVETSQPAPQPTDASDAAPTKAEVPSRPIARAKNDEAQSAPITIDLSDKPADAPTPTAPSKERNTAVTIYMRRDCQMMGLRALEVKNRVAEAVDELTAIPDDVAESEEMITENGLVLLIKTDKTDDELKELITKSPFVGRVAFASEQRDKDSGAPVQEPPRQFVERRRDSSSFGKAYANVEITKLDNLVDLVSEILILQMELARDVERRDYEKSDTSVAKLKKLILNLQEATLSTRMLPVRDTFLKMNRLVRDMCRKQEKDIRFITSGDDTEVDRSIIENISSPLMHIIRNSIDHGIESAEEREARGKPVKGKIELSAYTEGRNVVIAISDDGKGFDTERIRQKALDMSLITESQAANLPDEEINALVFLPGFSTNKVVTEYSGRGVGMDVVNEGMKKMNGKVIVQSVRNLGTKVILKIPLTLAIIDTIILRVGTETCAIPISFVSKILSMKPEDSVRNVNGEDVVLIGEECYKILNLFDFYAYCERIPYEDGILIIVGGEGMKKYVVFASEIIDRQDVVVKPAPALFKTIRGISGCTILGDGKISLILDTDELVSALAGKRS